MVNSEFDQNSRSLMRGELPPDMDFSEDDLKGLPSLDDDLASLGSDDFGAMSGPREAPAGEEESSGKEKEKKKSTGDRKKSGQSIALIAGAAVAVVLAMILLIRWAIPEPRPPEPTKKIFSPIPIPVYDEPLGFFLVSATPRGEKELIRIEIEFLFSGRNAARSFRKDEIVVRDVVYNFLSKNRPEHNGASAWQKFVQSELLQYLRSTFPQYQLREANVRMLERL